MIRPLLRRALLGAALSLLAPAAWAQQAAIVIDNFTFAPARLVVKPGTRVTFTNHDDIPHSIVIPDLGQHSKALDTGESVTIAFDALGEHPYICGLHPHMKGIVVVE